MMMMLFGGMGGDAKVNKRWLTNQQLAIRDMEEGNQAKAGGKRL